MIITLILNPSLSALKDICRLPIQSTELYHDRNDSECFILLQSSAKCTIGIVTGTIKVYECYAIIIYVFSALAQPRLDIEDMLLLSSLIIIMIMVIPYYNCFKSNYTLQ